MVTDAETGAVVTGVEWAGGADPVTGQTRVARPAAAAAVCGCRVTLARVAGAAPADRDATAPVTPARPAADGADSTGLSHKEREERVRLFKQLQMEEVQRKKDLLAKQVSRRAEPPEAAGRRPRGPAGWR